MAINYKMDDKGRIERYIKRVIREHKKDFEILESLRFLCVYRLNEPEYDKDAIPIEGIARKCPTRERDIYEKDVEIRIHFDSWQAKSKDQRYRLIFRTLLSIYIEQTEDLEIALDDDKRVIFRIIPPDVVVKAYSREIEEFGVPSKYHSTIHNLVNKSGDR